MQKSFFVDAMARSRMKTTRNNLSGQGYQSLTGIFCLVDSAIELLTSRGFNIQRGYEYL